MIRKWILLWLGLTAATGMAPVLATPPADDYDRFVIFGDSLSDPGNAFALLGAQSLPPYAGLDAFLVPNAPYARGGHHLSNGATWIEQLANASGVNRSAGPAFRGVEAFFNFAVGGARTRNDGLNVNLGDQVGAFLARPDAGSALQGALVVIAIGGNDVRDAAVSAAPAVLAAALGALQDNLIALHTAGAREFLIGNVPDIGLTPAIRRLDLLQPGSAAGATLVAELYNAQLALLLGGLSDPVFGLPGVTIRQLDLFQWVRDVVADPAAAGFANATEACVMPGVPPFACKRPDSFLFWDGIHPTRAGHALLAVLAQTALAN